MIILLIILIFILALNGIFESLLAASFLAVKTLLLIGYYIFMIPIYILFTIKERFKI